MTLTIWVPKVALATTLLALCGSALAQQEPAHEQTFAISNFIVPTEVLRGTDRPIQGLTASMIGEAIPDYLTSQVLERNAEIKIVDRQLIKHLLLELGGDRRCFGVEPWENTETQRLGRLLRARYMVTGTVFALTVDEVPWRERTTFDILAGQPPNRVTIHVAARLVDLKENRVLLSKSFVGSKRLAEGIGHNLAQSRIQVATAAHALAAMDSAARQMAEWILASPIFQAFGGDRK